MASGSFSSNVHYTSSGDKNFSRYVEVVWSSTNDTTNNKSTISWAAYVRSEGTSTTKWVNSKTITITIAGTTVYAHDEIVATQKNQKLGSGTVTVAHNANGKKSVSVSIQAAFFDYAVNSTYTGTIVMTNNPVYSITVTPGDGSKITIKRTSCNGVGSTGTLTAGTNKLCYGDLLKITFTVEDNYKIITRTVNGSSFTSGNTHTVTGDVTVVSTSQPLASSVGATDANIGSASTITVTKYATAYYHSLQYTFGDLSGYITSSGGVSASEVKFKTASIAFTVPTAFYAQIPNAKKAKCTIVCRTYSSSDSTTVLGDPATCTFTAKTTSDACAPTVTGTVKDVNESTIALTGDSNKLIRYKSTAQCTLTAVPKNSSTISTTKIRDTVVTGTEEDGVVTVTKNYTSVYSVVSNTSFAFSATDSRGYTSKATVAPDVVSYIKLTLNPIVKRPSPTGSQIGITFSGNYYRGSFGAYSNTLTVQYRYRASTESTFTSWTTIGSSNYTVGAKTYSTPEGTMFLVSDATGNTEIFDYKKSYVFEVRAYDGATTSDGTVIKLTTIKKTIPVQRGTPVFDWGEDDFNFNVAVKINDVNINDIFYPVDSVYLSSSNTIPSEISNIGTWTSITTGISGVYGWKRTA